MEGEKKYTKVKLFLLLVFIVLAFIYITQTWKFFNMSTANLAIQNKEFKCQDLNYEIEPISYKGNNLIFEIISKDYDTNITKLTIFPDEGNKNYSINLELSGGENQIIRIENITIFENFLIYAESCSSKIKTIKI